MKARRNPLSYLGYLGFLGFVGLWTFSTSLMVFFLFFFFFAYSKMELDELFWKNVRRAGIRALVVNLLLNCTLMLVMNIWGIAYYFSDGGWTNPVMENGMVVMETGLFTCYAINVVALVLCFIVTLCTFIFTLIYFHYKEQQNVDAEEEVSC